MLRDPSEAPEVPFVQQFFYRNVAEYEGRWLASRFGGMVAVLLLTLGIGLTCMLGSWYASKQLNKKLRTQASVP